MISYQKKFDHPVHFAKIYLEADKTHNRLLAEKWKSFLEGLEPLIQSGQISEEKGEELIRMVRLLEKMGVFPLWLSFFFKEAVDGTTPEDTVDQATFEAVFNTLPDEESSLFEKTLELLKNIEELHGSVEAFSDPNKFEKAFKKLIQFVDRIKDPIMLNELQTTSQIMRISIINLLLKSVDLFDTSVKQMKGSTQWSREEQVPLFHKMIGEYLNILDSWVQVFGPHLTIPTFDKWPLPAIIDKLKELFTEFSMDDESTLNPSRGYSVASSMFGSKTDFSRHLPNTLEDLFTLLHQNLIAVIANLAFQTIDLKMIDKSGLPNSFKEAVKTISKMEVKWVSTMTGLQVNDDGIVAEYNIPLRSHSAKMFIRHDNETGAIVLETALLGMARRRWGEIAFAAYMVDAHGIMSLQTPVALSDQEVRMQWRIPNAEVLSKAIKEFDNMCSYSI